METSRYSWIFKHYVHAHFRHRVLGVIYSFFWWSFTCFMPYQFCSKWSYCGLNIHGVDLTNITGHHLNHCVQCVCIHRYHLPKALSCRFWDPESSYSSQHNTAKQYPVRKYHCGLHCYCIGSQTDIKWPNFGYFYQRIFSCLTSLPFPVIFPCPYQETHFGFGI